jgi:hypothetical protein
VKLHAVLVIQVPHDFDFLDEAFLSVFLAECCLLGKGLDSTFLLSIVPLGKIDGGKVAFANFLDRLEVLMKTSLIEKTL